MAWGGKRQDILPGEEHLPLSALFEPYEAMAERRLATARFAYETQGDAFRNGERPPSTAFTYPTTRWKTPFSLENVF